jgi:membrane protein implicated in regulation of membrane protease activity
MDIWNTWWAWGALAILLAIGEVILPTFVLLGFGAGAAAVGTILFIGGAPAEFLAESIPRLILTYAVLSLVAWLVLRRFLGVYRGQVKTFDHDINEN